MLEESLLPFSFPAVDRKKVTAAFDGGRLLGRRRNCAHPIPSTGGVNLPPGVEQLPSIVR
jgi:hypothetical protein